MGEEVAFGALALLVLVSAVFVVSARNLFHAGLWLAPCLLGIAGFFLTLGAEFLAAIQVLIYIGGIMVLLLFAILLTRRIADPEVRVLNRQAGWAFLFSVAIIAVIVLGAWHDFSRVGAPLPAPTADTAQMGDLLLGPYLLPFEIASVILLAALIGAIVLAKGEKK